MIPNIPVRSLPKVFHVGAMNRDHRKASSHEGDGVSVSPCPEAWREIARLGDAPTWEVSSTTGGDLLFLDMHATRNDKVLEDTISEWAIGAGLATKSDQWLSVYFDSEIGSCRYMTSDSRDEAIKELDHCEIFEGDSLNIAIEKIEAGLAESAVVRQSMLCLTPSGQARSRNSNAGGIVGWEMAAVLWAEDVARSQDSRIVGCWWDDIFEPAGLSAPRGRHFH